MKKYRVSYIRTIVENYYVTAKNEKEADVIASERELNEEPDEEFTREVSSEIEEVEEK